MPAILLGEALNAATPDLAMTERITPLGSTALPGAVEEPETFMAEDAARWTSAVEASGARLE